MSHIKKPKAKGAGVIKDPAPAPNYDSMTPKFCLQHMVPGYSVADLQSSGKEAFANALFKRAKRTWGELKLDPRHGLGYERISRKSLKVSLPKTVVTEDVSLIAFRFDAKAPMVGYRDGDTFHILWLDHNFTVYDHG